MAKWSEPLLANHHKLRTIARAAMVAAAIFGVGGLILLLLEKRGVISESELETWRPALLVFSVGSLTAGVAVVFRLKGGGSLRWETRALTLATALAFTALSLPTIEGTVRKLRERNFPVILSTNAVKTEISVEVTCDACAQSIIQTLRTATLAEKAEIKPTANQVTVWYNPNVTTKEAIQGTLTNSGFLPPVSKN
jgi:hypothetical protein